MKRTAVIRDLRNLRNVGPKIAEKLYAIGVRSIDEVLDGDPRELYEKIRRREHGTDRCVLYLLRGAKADRPWPDCVDHRRVKKRHRPGSAGWNVLSTGR